MCIAMKIFVTFTVWALLAFHAFGSEWSSILPPDAAKPSEKDVTRENRTIKVGEVATIPLPCSKSYSCHAEIEGNTVRIVEYDGLSSLILQGTRAGRSTVRIFEKFWRDPDVRESYVLVGETVFQVTGSKSSRLIDPTDQARQDIPEPRLKGSMDWEGFISRQRAEVLTVITDSGEWTELWKSSFERPAPPVDFDRYAVACVFLGYNADWLYDIHIGDPRAEKTILHIPYGLNEIILELSGPFRASGQYRMKAIEKKKGYGMVLERQRDSGPR
ncbi:MAG: hypothetical protein VB050_09325 [Geobacteraceae bacterium]|nr:hypothetical protein [Geobacteraceae bacterium]